MKLNEIYGEKDTETTIQDMIITRFELGQLTYDQALKELKKSCSGLDLAFWEMELISAEANKEPRNVTPPTSKRLQ